MITLTIPLTGQSKSVTPDTLTKLKTAAAKGTFPACPAGADRSAWEAGWLVELGLAKTPTLVLVPTTSTTPACHPNVSTWLSQKCPHGLHLQGNRTARIPVVRPPGSRPMPPAEQLCWCFAKRDSLERVRGLHVCLDGAVNVGRSPLYGHLQTDLTIDVQTTLPNWWGHLRTVAEDATALQGGALWVTRGDLVAADRSKDFGARDDEDDSPGSAASVYDLVRSPALLIIAAGWGKAGKHDVVTEAIQIRQSMGERPTWVVSLPDYRHNKLDATIGFKSIKIGGGK